MSLNYHHFSWERKYLNGVTQHLSSVAEEQNDSIKFNQSSPFLSPAPQALSVKHGGVWPWVSRTGMPNKDTSQQPACMLGVLCGLQMSGYVSCSKKRQTVSFAYTMSMPAGSRRGVCISDKLVYIYITYISCVEYRINIVRRRMS